MGLNKKLDSCNTTMFCFMTMIIIKQGQSKKGYSLVN